MMRIIVTLLTLFSLNFVLVACDQDSSGDASNPGVFAPKPSVGAATSEMEHDDSTALYRAIVLASKQNRDVNEDLHKLYYLSSEQFPSFLAAMEKRNQATGNYFIASLQIYFKACASAAVGSEYKKICDSKLYGLNATLEYFTHSPVKLRTPDVCDAFGDLVANLACETANDLVATTYKIDKAQQ